MVSLLAILAVLAAAGALVSWIAGAVFYGQSLHALSKGQQRALMLAAVVTWPFLQGRLHSDAAEHGRKINKALVAFMACLLVAAAATAAATNLSRFSR